MKYYSILLIMLVLLVLTGCTHPVAGIYGKWFIDENNTPDDLSDDIVFEFINNGTLKMYPRDLSEGSYDVQFEIVDFDTIAIVQAGIASTEFDVKIERQWVKDEETQRSSLIQTLTLSNELLGIEPYVFERIK